jgi:hypothetical protein
MCNEVTGFGSGETIYIFLPSKTKFYKEIITCFSNPSPLTLNNQPITSVNGSIPTIPSFSRVPKKPKIYPFSMSALSNLTSPFPPRLRSPFFSHSLTSPTGRSSLLTRAPPGSVDFGGSGNGAPDAAAIYPFCLSLCCQKTC